MYIATVGIPIQPLIMDRPMDQAPLHPCCAIHIYAIHRANSNPTPHSHSHSHSQSHSHSHSHVTASAAAAAAATAATPIHQAASLTLSMEGSHSIERCRDWIAPEPYECTHHTQHPQRIGSTHAPHRVRSARPFMSVCPRVPRDYRATEARTVPYRTALRSRATRTFGKNSFCADCSAVRCGDHVMRDISHRIASPSRQPPYAVRPCMRPP
jgi:hypothetical protein